MTEPEMRVVQVSSIFDETPEGMYRMDRLQRRYDEQRAALDPVTRKILDEAEEAFDRAVVLGVDWPKT